MQATGAKKDSIECENLPACRGEHSFQSVSCKFCGCQNIAYLPKVLWTQYIPTVLIIPRTEQHQIRK